MTSNGNQKKPGIFSTNSMARLVVKGLLSTKHPILAQIIPTRRCNLACAYCNEYDDHSDPVHTDVMLKRIDQLAALGTTMISLSGGEPLLHPELEAIVRRIHGHGIRSEVLTNGFLLTEARIHKLNEAGLGSLQISIDNIRPDDSSKKSLKTLASKLELLAAHAAFSININSVLGGGVCEPEDALEIARRAKAYGFSATVGVIHDGSGQLKELSPRDKAAYEEFKKLKTLPFDFLTRFKDNLIEGKPNQWRCRAGSRYLYICEDGLVHYCSQQRGFPGIPLADYTPEHLRREFFSEKSCAPMCTVSCVHMIGHIDNWRAPQTALDKVSEVSAGHS